MGTCALCGEKAGLFRRVHTECQQRHDAGWAEMIDLAANRAACGTNLDDLESHLADVAARSHVPGSQVRQALVLGWCREIGTALERGPISETAETALTSYAHTFGFSDPELDTQGARQRLVKAAIIRDVIHGKVPSRVTIEGSLPFNLLKTESLVWLFRDCAYSEDRVHTMRVGGYQGVSLRVMKGVYYHVGGFQSQSVQTHGIERIDVGMLGVTNKNLYFAGKLRAMRIPYTKIVSFDAYSDAIGIHRDASNARPQIFQTNDGWFTYNLVANLAKQA